MSRRVLQEFMLKIKSKDIAKELGVSTATVSLAINGKPGVNQRTRAYILEYIERKQHDEYGLINRQKVKKEGLIVFLIYKKHGIIFGRGQDSMSLFFQEIKRIAGESGYNFTLAYYQEQYDDLEKMVINWKSQHIRGLYMMGAEMNQGDIYPFFQLNIPIVVGDNDFYNEGIDSYMVDNRDGINRAVDYLIDFGHSHIVYLAENIDIYNFNERREAFVLEMAKRECGDVSQRIVNLGKTVEEVYQTMSSYLNGRHMKTTAFVLESSVVSLGVTKALLENNICIPKDISLIGFDALPEKIFPGFELTLIKGTHTRRHMAAVKHLIRHIEESKVEIVRTYYRTRIFEGNSVFDKTKYIYT